MTSVGASYSEIQPCLHGESSQSIASNLRSVHGKIITILLEAILEFYGGHVINCGFSYPQERQFNSSNQVVSIGEFEKIVMVIFLAVTAWSHLDRGGSKKAQRSRAFVFFFWIVFLTSSSTTRLYRGRAPRQSWETMTSVSAGHIILTPTQR